MSIPLPEKPHTTKIVGGVETIIGRNETMLVSSSEGRLWIQNGRVFDEAGKSPAEIPDWFWEEFRKVSPEMQAKHGGVAGLKKAHSEATAHLRVTPPESPFQDFNEVRNVGVEDFTNVDLHSLSKAELVTVAHTENVEIASGDTKEAMINKILAARE